MKKLKNKNCLITGAASGIGRSLALGLAKEGMNLFISDVNMDNLENVRKEVETLGAKVYTGKCDISKLEDFEKLAEDAFSKFKVLDLFINNAGVGMAGFSETLDLEQWKYILDINLWGVIHAVKVFLPRLLEQGHGHFITTGSGAGVVGLPFHLPYIASKFAVSGITEALYSEFSHKGLNFSVICPTQVKTNIAKTAQFKFTPDMVKGNNVKDIDKNLKEFTDVLGEEYFKEGITPDEAAKRYIKKIKKNKLYIFDKRILAIAMFLKGFSKKLYKKVLRKECDKDLTALDIALSNVGLELKNR